MKKVFIFLIMVNLFCWVKMGYPFDFKVSSELNFDWWQDTKDNKARQSYIPLSLEARYKDFSLNFLTGYAYTHKDPDTGPTRSFQHLLDSKLNLSYEVIDKLPIDLLIGIDFNLPTGKTDLKVKEIELLMDPYLVSISNFGEGFNINPTISLAKEWGKWVFGVGGGYLWRGEYDFGTVWENSSAMIKIKDYLPGEILSLTGEIRYEFDSYLRGRLFGNYFWYEKSKWKEVHKGDGFSSSYDHTFKEGELWLLGTGFNYQRKKWNWDLTFKGIFREKNRYDYKEIWNRFDSTWYVYLTHTPSLTKERRNSHGDEWVGDLSVKYFLNDQTTLKSYFQALFITKNDYPSFSPHYQGRREKYSLGFGLHRIFSPHLEAEVYVKGFVMHDGERRFPLNYYFPESARTLSERHYKGFSAGLMVTGKF